MKRISNTVTQLTWLQDTPFFVSPFDNKSNKHYKMVLRKKPKVAFLLENTIDSMDSWMVFIWSIQVG
jgi:hypothetical protein